ncbi:kinase-like domain-containing protein [Whalleya microplaca]|nr:kinase-like domain-containing protein [Whalleya microplaca]
MLKAIDFLGANGLIHRDLKPENILYTSRQGQYHFQLGDLGFCNHANLAATVGGTQLFAAPEIYYRQKQTHKIDVLVTLCHDIVDT